MADVKRVKVNNQENLMFSKTNYADFSVKNICEIKVDYNTVDGIYT